MLDSVWSLLELSDLSDDVWYLKGNSSWYLKHSVDVQTICRTCRAAVLHVPTILILEKLTRPSSVKLGVPSSIKARSVRYIPRYGTHGGLQLEEENMTYERHGFMVCVVFWLHLIALKSHFFRVSLRFLNLPSEDTVFCSLSIRALVWNDRTH